MFNIINHRENEIKMTVKYSLHTHLDGYNQKRQIIISVGDNVKKLGSSYTVGGNVKWCPTTADHSSAVPQIVKQCSYFLAISLLDIHSREMKICDLIKPFPGCS